MTTEDIPQGYKRCKNCKAIYCISLFPTKMVKGEPYVMPNCTTCQKKLNNKSAKKWRDKNPDKIAIYMDNAKLQQKEWNNQNPDKVAEYNKKQRVIKGH